jgi:nicotinamide N-methyltransferase
MPTLHCGAICDGSRPVLVS